MRISDWSSDVCSSDLIHPRNRDRNQKAEIRVRAELGIVQAAVERGVQQRAGRLDRHPLDPVHRGHAAGPAGVDQPARSEEHTSELQSLMRISYAVFCLKKKKNQE